MDSRAWDLAIAPLRALPPDVRWSVGEDDDNPGRFYVEIQWSDPVARHVLRFVNEPTPLSNAVSACIAWYVQERAAGWRSHG